MGAGTEELDVLVADLEAMGTNIIERATPIIDKLGESMRDDARENAPGAHGGHAKLYPQTITHEVVTDERSVGAVVGPERGGQGNLGVVFEFGTVDTPPDAHLGPALDRGAEQAVAQLAEMGAELG